jgi:hypothetical protein
VTDWAKILIDTLKAHAGLSALVAVRTYWGLAPAPQTAAYLTAIDIGSASSTQHGNAGAAGSVDTVQIQLTAWAPAPVTAHDVRAQARLAVDSLMFGTGNKVACTVGNQFTTYDTDAKLYGAVLQITLHVQN